MFNETSRLFAETHRESALAQIEQAVSDMPVMEYIAPTNLAEFYEWAGEYFRDFETSKGIDGKAMLEYWLAQEDEPSSRPRQYHAA